MSKEWKKSKVVEWSDELNDDFDELNLDRPPVRRGYPYKRTNKVNNFFSDAFYYGIALPIFYLVAVFKGVKIENKKNLKLLKGSGAYIYSNHVSYFDVCKMASPVCFGRRVNILGYSDTTTIPVVKHLARALGYLPVPLQGDYRNLTRLSDATKYYYDKKQFIVIYPEAHIWPYYTKIRNFRDASFTYPVLANAPVLPITTVWRKAKIGKKPKQTIVIGTPIYPINELNINENRKYLRDECYKQMVEVSESRKQYEYIKYIRVNKKGE